MKNVSAVSPIVNKIPWTEPSALFKAAASKKHTFYLNSSLNSPKLGRYSYIGFEPFLTFSASGPSIRLEQNGKISQSKGDPFEVLESLMAKYRMLGLTEPIPFTCGAVGYLGYELRHFAEKLPESSKAPSSGYADAWFGFYDALFAFDHLLHNMFVISTGLSAQYEARNDVATAKADGLSKFAGQIAVHKYKNEQPVTFPAGKMLTNMSKDEYAGMVNKARQYIEEGEIYQANLSQQFKCKIGASAELLYLGLCARNPAPFSCYIDTEEIQILSSSPERFLKIDGKHIETRPIKGTMPRGSTLEEDNRLINKLKASTKDKAEHIMIVDLERNDLGKVCLPGSVKVDELMALESYATVHHLTSTITGELKPEKRLDQILRACFPGGSITGAPKIRAMQIIDELEPTNRGIYTGCIGYLGFDGNLDLNIAIRTIVIQRGTAIFNLGGGIVYDSDPEKEYQETLDKGKAIFELLTSYQPGAAAAKSDIA
ncbi:MAG: aminodeoxychorismate synthase component I [Dehalococcoidia bacterium]|nr:aminodeoxychorismate synthase component I [Dehalococcoidia bacterium]